VIFEQTILEKDKLLTILTKKEGLIRAFAKGAKNFLRCNSSAFSLFCYSDFILYKTKNSYNLGEACSIKYFFDLRYNLEKLSLAEYFCELIINLSVQPQESNKILRLMLNSLHFLLEETLDKSILKSIFEIRILCASGYSPNLCCCKKCLSRKDDGFYLVSIEGCIYCKKCLYTTKNRFIELSRGTLLALRHIVSSSLEKAFYFSLSEENKRNFCKTCEEYTISCIEKKINTLVFYKQICKI
jgi:DNA repair protein RecO (recombination protein O)